MRIQEKQKALEQEVIANLCAIPKMPENMLPHTVYVEEEGEDGYGHGIPGIHHVPVGGDTHGRKLHALQRGKPGAFYLPPPA